ncbi:MAG: DUF4012 domain-containing protein [Patescibacteria group bacterium]
MSVLTTQIIEESPRVLLLGNYLPFLQSMESVFSEFQLKTWILSDQEISHIDVDTLDKNNVYKIIWWLDLENRDSLEKIKKFVEKNLEIPVIIVTALPDSFVSLTEPIEKLEQFKFIQDLTVDLPNSLFFFIRDFFDQNYLPSLFRFSLLGLEKDVLLDPQQACFFIGLKTVIENLKTALFKPHTPQKIVLQGKKISSTKALSFFAEIFSRVYGRELEIIQSEAVRETLKIDDLLVVNLETDEKPLISNLVEKTEQLKNQLTTLSSLNKQKLAELTKTPSTTSLEAEKTVQESKSDVVAVAETIKIKKEPIYQSKNTNEAKEEKIEGELTRLFKEKRTVRKEKRLDEKVKILKKVSNKSKKNKVLFTAGIGIMIFGGISLALWLVLEISILFAKQDFYQYLYQNTPQNNQQYQLGFWPQFLEKQTSFYQKILGELILEKVMIAGLFQDFNELQSLQLELADKTGSYILGILGTGEAQTVFSQEIVDLAVIIETKINEVEEAIFYLNHEETAEQQKWTKYLAEYKNEIAKIKEYQGFFTNFFGGEGKKTYAVLLQNNLEIRPTGGFVQGIALLTFDQGLLIDSQIFNTNEIDTRLPGAVTSPEEIKRYLGEKTWFIRDSNWDPDFPTTAKRVIWFIQEALKKRVDGVIAINYYVLQDVLAAIDSLEIPDYQEVLTKDNLLERVEFHSDDEFVNQQNSQQKDYAGIIYKQLFQDLKTLDKNQALVLTTAFKTGLENKDVLVSLSDEKYQEFLQKMGWSGEIINPSCPQSFPQTNCLVQQIYQVEANIGLNRVNEYIDRKIEERVEFVDKKIKHIRTVTYTNSAKTDGWPLGSYKLYLRFITAKDTQPREVLINGKKLNGNLANVYSERENKVVGFPLEIPKESTVTVQYTYETAKLLDEPFSYLLFDQKQPGVNRDDLVITLYFPGRKPTLIAPQGNLVGDTIEFTAQTGEHSFVGVGLQTK